MSRSNLPQTDADRIAVAITVAAVAAIVWLIVAFSPNPREMSVAAVQAIAPRAAGEVIDGATHVTASPASTASARGPVKSTGII